MLWDEEKLSHWGAPLKDTGPWLLLSPLLFGHVEAGSLAPLYSLGCMFGFGKGLKVIATNDQGPSLGNHEPKQVFSRMGVSCLYHHNKRWVH